MRSRRHQYRVRNGTISRAAQSHPVHNSCWFLQWLLFSRDLQFSLSFVFYFFARRRDSNGRFRWGRWLTRAVSAALYPFLPQFQQVVSLADPFLFLPLDALGLLTFRLLSTLPLPQFTPHSLLSQRSVHGNCPHPSGDQRLSIPWTRAQFVARLNWTVWLCQTMMSVHPETEHWNITQPKAEDSRVLWTRCTIQLQTVKTSRKLESRDVIKCTRQVLSVHN